MLGVLIDGPTAVDGDAITDPSGAEVINAADVIASRLCEPVRAITSGHGDKQLSGGYQSDLRSI